MVLRYLLLLKATNTDLDLVSEKVSRMIPLAFHPHSHTQSYFHAQHREKRIVRCFGYGFSVIIPHSVTQKVSRVKKSYRLPYADIERYGFSCLEAKKRAGNISPLFFSLRFLLRIFFTSNRNNCYYKN